MTVIFIYHEIQIYGAGAALSNLELYHKKHGIPTAMLFLYDIRDLSFINKYTNPVVVCNTILSYPIVDALSKLNIPTYWYIHEWIDSSHNWLQHFNHNIFHSNIKPIFVCHKSYENYKQHIPYIKNHMIMYNGISQDTLYNKVNEYIILKKEITIAMIGSIEDRKNQQLFIDNVFYKLKQPIRLILVGRMLKQIQINPEYKESILIIGHVSNALPYIESADIIVSYSLNEVLPMHIIESFYCKKPVISTNVGGISEMIESDVNGYLIQPNDSEMCLKYLNQLIENKDLREKIGERAYETFLTKFEENVTFKLL